MPVKHSYTPPGVDSGVAADTSLNDWTAAHLTSWFPMMGWQSSRSNLNWVAPAALTDLTSVRGFVDLTEADSAYVHVMVENSGASTPRIGVQFDPLVGSTTFNGNWVWLDNVSGPYVTINAHGPLVGAAVTIDVANRTKGRVKFVGLNGNGSDTKFLRRLMFWVK